MPDQRAGRVSRMEMASAAPREGNFVLERHGDRLIARSVYSGFTFGLLWTAALVAMTVTLVRQGVIGFDSPYDVGVMALLFAGGLFTMLRRDISTSFARGVPRVLQERTVGRLWRWRRREYSFEDIAGVGVRTYPDEEGKRCYRPIITLKDDRTVSLSHSEESRFNADEIIGQICTATGLPRLDPIDSYFLEAKKT